MTTGLFPHDNFSSVYWIFTKLSHMIPLWKGKNPIYFGVITIIPFDNLYRRAYFVMHTFIVVYHFHCTLLRCSTYLHASFKVFVKTASVVYRVCSKNSSFITPYQLTNMATISNSCFWLVDFWKQYYMIYSTLKDILW